MEPAPAGSIAFAKITQWDIEAYFLVKEGKPERECECEREKETFYEKLMLTEH